MTPASGAYSDPCAIDETMSIQKDLRGRGAASNSTGRFEKTQTQPDLSDAGWLEDEDVRPLKTEFFKDNSKSVVAHNDSPDIPFTFSINPYRGCEHGCVYCYARPTHEFLGLSAGLDFESKIFVKERAPELLRERLMKKNWQPQMIAMSGVTDCYQPAEKKFELTRRCLQVLAEFKNPVGIITKNRLVTRDIDILAPMAAEKLVCVYISITTLDAELARTMEPRTSSPRGRLEAIEKLALAGVPVGVNVAPVVPGLTDHEMPLILRAAHDAGAQFAGFVPLRLPYSVKDLFVEWLEKNRPERKEKVLSAIREIRGGELNNARFGERMAGEGPIAQNMAEMFKVFSAKFGFNKSRMEFNTSAFCRPTDQLSLF
jgi:DNA repair photolyase